MAQKFYNVAQAAQVLGVSADDVKELMQQRRLHGYRDGADWKFKVEQVDQLAAALRRGGDDAAQSDLLSEIELGEPESGASGKIIGDERSGGTPAESDLKLSGRGAAGGGQADDLELTIDGDLSLDAAGLDEGVGKAGDSAVDLSGKQPDDDIVLGGSGAGSDITIGGDSGISLVDPADSGLSLDEPLDLGVGDDESLELGEEDMLSLAEASTIGAAAQDTDFLLTPSEDAIDAEESESGSQVIALDESAGDEAATMVGGGVAAMLDEDFGAQPLGMPGIPLGAAGPPGAPQMAGAAMFDPSYALPEAPYTAWNIVLLAFCAILLVLCGMFMYDLLRNMWSWDSPYTVNSSLMDTILSWFEG